MTLAEAERSERESATSQCDKLGEKHISELLCIFWYIKQLHLWSFYFAATLGKNILLFQSVVTLSGSHLYQFAKSQPKRIYVENLQNDQSCDSKDESGLW